jgi:signal transduction histidine kinase
MKRANMDLLKIKHSPNSGLYLSLLFFGMPLALGVLALLFWTQSSADYKKMTNVQYWIEPLKTTQYNSQGFEKLATELPDFSNAKWAPIHLPNSKPLTDAVDITPQAPMARIWFKFNYKLPENIGLVPDYAIYTTRIMGGAYAVWVNDELVHLSLKEWRMQWNYPAYVPIPIKLIKPNAIIEVKVAIPYRLSQGYAMGSTYAGKAGSLANSRDIRTAIQIKFSQFATGFMLLAGLMSFHLWLSRKQDTANLILALASIAFLICNFQYFYELSEHDIASRWYGSLVDSSVMWVLILTYFYAMQAEKKSFPLFEKFLIIATIGLTVATLPMWGYGKYALIFQVYFEVIFGIIISLVLSYVSYKGASLEFRIITFAQWVLMLLGIHDVIYMTSQSSPDQIYIFPYATLAVIFSFLYASQRQHIQALYQVENLNESLSSKLVQRESELNIQHAKLVEAERNQTLLLERQRLVRDMHDGIGSSLMTTLAIAKQGQASPERMTDVLRDCLDDLKNVIESLEPIEHDLATLLGMLRQRLGKRIEEAGLKIIWQVDDMPALNWLEPPQALQISRMVQEIFTNVLKHAQASEIKLVANHIMHNGKSTVSIAIQDNGVGFDGKMTESGRGLKNLLKRSQEIGGELLVSSSKNNGTTIKIYLPVVANSRL